MCTWDALCKWNLVCLCDRSLNVYFFSGWGVHFISGMADYDFICSPATF